jgi:hypothetical protein
MIGWKITLFVSLMLVSAGTAFDRLIPLRFKHRLHDLMVRWWVQLDATSIPQYPSLLASWILRLFLREKKRPLRHLFLYAAVALMLMSVPWTATLPNDDPETMMVVASIPPEHDREPDIFDRIQLPHVLGMAVIFSFDMVVVALTFHMLRLIQKVRGVASLAIVAAHGFLSGLAAIACFAGFLSTENLALEQNMVGMRKNRLFLAAAEPKFYMKILEANHQALSAFGTNADTFKNLSERAIATEIDYLDSYWERVKKAPRVLYALLSGEQPWWRENIRVRIVDPRPGTEIVITYNRDVASRLSGSLLFAVSGTLMLPAVLLGACLLIMYLARAVLACGRTLIMYFFDLTTEEVGRDFSPGTRLGIVFALFAAIVQCVVEILDSLRGE